MSYVTNKSVILLLCKIYYESITHVNKIIVLNLTNEQITCIKSKIDLTLTHMHDDERKKITLKLNNAKDSGHDGSGAVYLDTESVCKPTSQT